ncbi:hypothetical protein BsIDN1_18100 [Bacillus safensis]|uniref:Uncharacterized protein n=1 Tax=Bacillus safensis TaxID=561879 RepID=A0A5S9M6C7_BACIA|nr:hypothetical protein BsIDN1_18100 [Bacillus safensis]
MNKNGSAIFFENKPLTVQHPVRVYYFQMIHQEEQRQQIKEAVNNSLEHTHFIWTGPETAMLIQPNATSENSQLDQLNDLSLAITSDFLTDSVFIQGQLHLPNDHLQMRLLNEQQLFFYTICSEKSLDQGLLHFINACLRSFVMMHPHSLMLFQMLLKKRSLTGMFTEPS